MRTFLWEKLCTEKGRYAKYIGTKGREPVIEGEEAHGVRGNLSGEVGVGRESLIGVRRGKTHGTRSP